MEQKFIAPYFATRRTFARLSGAVVLAGMGMRSAHAQAATVKVVAAYPAGGATDALTRLMAENLNRISDKNYIVDNKPGAAGKVALAIAMASKPDGHTLLSTSSTAFSLNPQTHRDPKEWAIPNMEPVAPLGLVDFAFYVAPNFPANSMEEYLTVVRQDPKLGFFGTSGIGGVAHFAGLLIRKAARVSLQDVPFAGGGPQMLSVMGGHTPAGINSIGKPLVQAAEQGKIKILATLGSKRSPFLPKVPTMRELNFPDVVVTDWIGLFAPVGTPSALIAALNAQIAATASQPRFAEALASSMLEPMAASPAECMELIRRDYKRWEPIIRASGVVAD